MVDETSMIWLQLLERRSSIHERSKLDESAARSKTFAAAMQQFEEQYAAARVVTPATRPLNLYYGLMQAGMAVAAAHASGQWSFSSHGLELSDTTPDLADIRVKPKKIGQHKGAYQLVTSSTTGSPEITDLVSVGALWSSLPDLGQEMRLPGITSPQALPVTPEMQSLINPGTGIAVRNLFFKPPGANIYVQAEMPDIEREAWFKQLIAYYPSATGWHPDFARWNTYGTDKGAELSMTIRASGFPVNKAPWSEELMTSLCDDLAPEYRFRGNRHLRPSIEGDGKPPPSPLMTWWLLLYSFSMLARYQPRKWVALLDLDKSRCAAQIRYALETALTAVPQFIIEALDGKSWLLSNQMSTSRSLNS